MQPTASPWRVFTLIIGATLVGTLNFSLVFVAFSEFEETFDASTTATSWTLTAYSITLASLMVPGGWLADRFGRKKLFLIGVALLTFGSALVALAPSIELMVAARVVQAAGFALESPAALAILLDTFGPERRSTAIGALGGVGGISAAFGPVVGGALIYAVGWRWAFAVNIPIGLITLAVGARFLPKTLGGDKTGAPDFLGAAALMVGVGSLALAIVQSNTWGWTSTAVVAAFLIAGALLTLVVLRSREHTAPILEITLFRNRQFSRANLLSILVAGNFAATFLTFLTFLQEAWGWSEFESGLGVAFIPAIGGPLSIFSGRLADRFGHRAVILPGAIIMSLSGVWFASAISYEPDLFGLWLPAAGLYSVGVGLGHAASQAAAVATVPAPKLGIGGAMSRIFQEIGSTIAVAVVVTFLANTDTGESLDGVRQAMTMLVFIGVAGALIAIGLPSHAQHVADRDHRVDTLG